MELLLHYNKTVIREMFGPHLTLDIYGCDKEKLKNYELVYKMLDELPGIIGMHKYSEPVLHNIAPRENSFDQGGLTGFVILVESHISIHTFPEDNFASIDIFSCKSFDSKKATEHLVGLFEAKKIESNVKRRGREFVKHYPRSVEKADAIAIRERAKA